MPGNAGLQEEIRSLQTELEESMYIPPRQGAPVIEEVRQYTEHVNLKFAALVWNLLFYRAVTHEDAGVCTYRSGLFYSRFAFCLLRLTASVSVVVSRRCLTATLFLIAFGT